MSSVKTTQIDGDVSVGRDVAIGRDATLQGGALIKGNVKILGWLEAHNIKLPYKGLFLTDGNLKETYPLPHDGWWAIVGETVPGPIWIAWKGKWGDTGAVGGNILDALNLEQAKKYADSKAAETLADANRYTDGREEVLRQDYAMADEETLRDAKKYADDGDGKTLASAKEYTNEKSADALEKAKDYAEEKAEDTLRAAQDYHDEHEEQLREDMDEADMALRREFADADRKTLQKAEEYADEQDAKKLAEARKYADDMDEETLAAANRYTDGKSVEVTEAFAMADAETLRSAQSYADTLTSDLLERAYQYCDNTEAEITEAYQAADEKEKARATGEEERLQAAITAGDTKTLAEAKKHADTKIPYSEKGFAGGVAELDHTGRVPSVRLPATFSPITDQNRNGIGYMKLWAGTKAQYEAIVSPSEDTIYFVDGDDPSFLSVSPESLSFGGEGGRREISIDCGSLLQWSISGLPRGWDVSPLSGTGPNTVRIIAPGNPASEPVQGTIIVSGGGMAASCSYLQEAGHEQGPEPANPTIILSAQMEFPVLDTPIVKVKASQACLDDITVEVRGYLDSVNLWDPQNIIIRAGESGGQTEVSGLTPQGSVTIERVNETDIQPLETENARYIW